MKKNQLTPLGEKIFLDRYALKDGTKGTLGLGSTVIVQVDGQREIGKVLSIKGGTEVSVELKDGTHVNTSVEAIDLPLETNIEQLMDRVARGAASVEEPENQEHWQAKFRELLDDFKFLPGGRILAGCGTDQSLTYFNCYVLPSPKDSREGLFETLSQMAEIMSRGGGVGINLSSLRPQYAYVKGVNGRSSGAVSWGGLYSFTTGLIEQGGCLSESSNILTDLGSLSVLKIVEMLERGESVNAWTHEGWKPVTDKFRNGVKPTFKLQTTAGYSVTLTGCHKVMVFRGSEGLVLEPVSNLKPGDTIALLKGSRQPGVEIDLIKIENKNSYKKVVDLPSKLTPALAELVGYFTANGSVIWKNKGIKIVVPSKFPKDKDRLLNLLEKSFPSCSPGCYLSKTESYWTIELWSTQILDFLKVNGLLKTSSKEAKVPDTIKLSGQEVVEAFLAGYLAGDGCFLGQPYVSSASEIMIREVQELALSVGIGSKGFCIEKVVDDKSFAGWGLSFPGKIAQTKLLEIMDGRTQRVEGFHPSTQERSWVWPENLYNLDRSAFSKILNPGSDATSINAVERACAKLSGENSEILKLLNMCMPAEVASIDPAGEQETYDITVDDVHKISANGIYMTQSRRGALMLILNDWHPDILSFIDAKREAGKITNANISVGVSDAFMAAVKSDSNWGLRFPDTSDQLYAEHWDGSMDAWEAIGGGVITYKTVKAREVWDKIIASAHASAEPGVWFKDRSNQDSNSWYYEELICTNPCVTGDTLVSTVDGQVPIRDLATGKGLLKLTTDSRMWDDPIVAATRAWSNGVKPVYLLETDGEHRLMLTANHKVMTDVGWVEAKDLTTDHCLMTNLPYIKSRFKSLTYSHEEEVFDISVPGPECFIANDIVIHNCGEQPLPKWSVCNLGHINLSKFMQNKLIDWEALEDSVRSAVRFLDNVIDATPYFFDENKDQQKRERRIGLGTMGLAEMLIKAEIAYGSEESLVFVEELFKFIAESAYLESANLASEKGSFPAYEVQLTESGFTGKLHDAVVVDIHAQGLRNVTLLTQAPTGTVGTMVNTSTGIEPFYFWSYMRKGRLGMHEEKVQVVLDWEAANPGKPLPPFFVSAMDLSPSDHVKVQAAIQKWTDSAISKTCNCPSDYTVEQTKELYELMYDLGCKGGTIYRDKSRDEQVLNLAPEPEPTQVETKIEKTRPRPYKRYGATVSKSTPAGTAHVTMNDDEEGNPLEIFIDIGKGGSDIRAMAEAIGRLASLVLRVSSPLTPMERVDLIVGQLSGIGGPRSSGFGKTRVLSLPDGLAQALEEHYQEYTPEADDTYYEEPKPTALSSVKVDLCPGCGNTSLVSAEGCQSCFNCGHAEC